MSSKYLLGLQNSPVCAEQTSLIHGGPNSQLTGLKGSAASILVRDTTAHLQGSSGVHASTGQGCFGSKRGSTGSTIRKVVVMLCLIGVEHTF